jgi:nucleoside-diphosphate-sugar epimerase
MRVLFIGGTGLISSASTTLALARGIDLTLVNRGRSPKADVPAGAAHLVADIHDVEAFRSALREDVEAHGRYDAVVQWIAFTPEHVALDIETFADLTDQYVFISSASAYETPPSHYLAREDTTPLDNPYWQYSRDKAEAERILQQAGREREFPFTIVRPSHTYGYPDFPLAITSPAHPWTIVDRIRAGKRFIVHGDGTSLWTVTDHRDFAVGLVGLLGNDKALREDFHITSDDVLTWNQICEYVADAIGVSRTDLADQAVHIPSELLVRLDRDAFEGPLMGDKMHAGVFDNAKLKAAVPDFAPVHTFKESVKETVAWFEADPSRRSIDDDANALWDDITDRYVAATDALLR